MLLEGRFVVLRFPMGVRVDAEVDETRRARRRHVRAGVGLELPHPGAPPGARPAGVRGRQEPHHGQGGVRHHRRLRPAAESDNPVIALGFGVFGRFTQRRFYRAISDRLAERVRAVLEGGDRPVPDPVGPDDVVRAPSLSSSTVPRRFARPESSPSLARPDRRRITDVTSPRTEWFRPMTARDPARGAPRLVAAGAPVRPDVRGRDLHRRGRAPPRDQRGPRARGGPRLPRRVLRDLVGVDELHVVRLGLRLRRRALPCPDGAPDGRRPRARRRCPRRVRALRHRHRRARLHDHADRDDRAVAARCPRRPGARHDRPDLCRRARRHPSALDRAGVRPGLVGPPRLRRAGGRRAGPAACSPSRAPSTRRGPRPARRRGTPSTSPSATGC